MDQPLATGRYDAVWKAAEPYLRARKNDIHVPLSYVFAQRLLSNYSDADPDIVSLAILLHDVGWWSIDHNEILEKAFGPDMMTSDVRILHEKEGVRLSIEILAQTGWSEVSDAVAEIIDGHDTRPDPKGLNDSLVRDADKLWRFTSTGIAVACDWFNMTPGRYAERLRTTVLPQLETDLGRVLAEQELGTARQQLMLHLI